ncbi:hypothetical protein ACFVRB_07020 [Streptomyces nojiriensis]|uniref:hypothetical protein n=1 Tax=Streptomyces nojiriensis TaxID=66374 RepID=UPI0036D7F5DA
MEEQVPAVPVASQTTLAREVLGPLGGLVECGAALASVSVDDVESRAREIAGAIGGVCVWVGAGGGRSLREVFLMWRVAFLPGLLRPSSGSAESFKRRLRAYTPWKGSWHRGSDQAAGKPLVRVADPV